MAFPVLVASPTPGFGELLQQTLQDTGEYEVALTRSAREARAAAEARPFILAVLDGDLPDMALDALMQSLRASRPALRFVLILPETLPDAGLRDAPGVCGALGKPFYLPDLLDAVQKGLEAANASARRGQDSPQPDTPALPDVVRPVSRGSSTRPVPMTLDAPPPWLMDVNRAARHLMRLSLQSAAQAALILRGDALWAYAGGLSQPAAQELTHTVSRHWANGGGSDLARFIRLGVTGSEYMLYATHLGGEFVLAMVFDAETPFSEIRAQAGSLARALAEPPPPSPAAEPAPERRIALHPETPLEARVPPERVTFSDLENDNRMQALPAAAQVETAEAEASPATAEAPAGRVSGAGEGLIALEPESPAVFHLKYACVLIPRLPTHYLTGDLTARLSEWVGQLCIAFAWRLEYIAVRPDHLHWIVSVPPDTSPSYLMRILRQHTSQRIFAEFPRLAQENPSGDFWAPGYLIMGSAQPAPPQLIRDFIRQTRRRQGIA